MKFSSLKEELERTKSQVEGLEQIGVLFSLFLPKQLSEKCASLSLSVLLVCPGMALSLCIFVW